MVQRHHCLVKDKYLQDQSFCKMWAWTADYICVQHMLDLEDTIVNIDAEEQLELMKEITEKQAYYKKIKVSLRLNPGIGRGFNPGVITAGAKSRDGTPIKFGIEEERIIPALQRAVQYGFTPVGLHQHLGSGWTRQDFEAVKQAVNKIIQKCLEIEKLGIFFDFIDFENRKGFRFKQRHGHGCHSVRKEKPHSSYDN